MFALPSAAPCDVALVRLGVVRHPHRRCHLSSHHNCHCRNILHRQFPGVLAGWAFIFVFLQHQDRLDPPILGGATSATVAAVATVTLVFGLPGESNPGNADLFRFDLETAFFLGALLDLKVARAVALATLDTWFEWSAFSGVAAKTGIQRRRTHKHWPYHSSYRRPPGWQLAVEPERVTTGQA